MNDPMSYYRVTRKEWREFYRNGQTSLTQNEPDNIKSLNDRISMQDVRDIYVPLAHLIYLYMKEFGSLFLSEGLFLHKHTEVPPFTIGVARSMATGKSTTARLLQTILPRIFKRRSIQLIATGGFLYPNRILEERGTMDRKGFPENYDMEMLINFLSRIKSGQEEIEVPIYSRNVYDTVPDKYELIQQPDILVVEGINTLQLPANRQIYVSNFSDFSVYVDADPVLIEKWYLDRFGTLLDTTFQNPENYYYCFAIGDREEIFKIAKDIWKSVNLKNLQECILPTRGRADVILHKTEDHIIDSVFMRKY